MSLLPDGNFNPESPVCMSKCQCANKIFEPGAMCFYHPVKLSTTQTSQSLFSFLKARLHLNPCIKCVKRLEHQSPQCRQFLLSTSLPATHLRWEFLLLFTWPRPEQPGVGHFRTFSYIARTWTNREERAREG